MRPSRYAPLCVLLLAAASAALAAHAASGPAPKPWSLPDKYTVTVGNMTLNYDVKTAEWHLEVDGVNAASDHRLHRIAPELRDLHTPDRRRYSMARMSWKAASTASRKSPGDSIAVGSMNNPMSKPFS